MICFGILVFINFSLNLTGEVHFYSRRTMTDTNIASKLTGNPLKVKLDKARLLCDPFAAPAWFPLTHYTRRVAKQKRTIQDDDDDDDVDDKSSENKSKGVVIKKRSLAELQNNNDAEISINTGSGGVSLDAIKKQFNANSTLLAEGELDVTSAIPFRQCNNPSVVESDNSNNDMSTKSGGPGSSGNVGVSNYHKRGRLSLPVPHHPLSSRSTSSSNANSGFNASVLTSRSATQDISIRSQHAVNVDESSSGSTRAHSDVSLHARWLQAIKVRLQAILIGFIHPHLIIIYFAKDNEEGGITSLQRMTSRITVSGVVVVYEELTVAEPVAAEDDVEVAPAVDCDEPCVTKELTPRACAISIDLSW
jgi:hypothetical protein